MLVCNVRHRDSIELLSSHKISFIHFADLLSFQKTRTLLIIVIKSSATSLCDNFLG